MRNLVRLGSLGLGLAFLMTGVLGAEAQASTTTAPSTTPTTSAEPTSQIVHLTLNGVVDPMEANYLQGGIAKAQLEGASAVLITIDTPGGLDTSMREIVQAILNANVPVICYVSPAGARAASAGTFITMACPVAAMAPGTNIGAAHPVGVSGAIEQQKVLDDAVAYIQSIANLRGRNPDWAAEAVKDSVSAAAEDAVKLNVVDLVSPSTADLLQQIDGRTVQVGNGDSVTLHTAGVPVTDVKMGIGAAFLHALLTPDFSFLFFWLGFGTLVFWLFHPHLVIPGLVGLLLLLASLVTFGLLPFQLIGIAFLAISATSFAVGARHHGFGIPLAVGVVTLIVGGLVLFNPAVPNARVSPPLIVLVAALMALLFGVALAAALRVRGQAPLATGPSAAIGRFGEVTRGLDPDGIVLVGAQHWTARAASGNIPAGARVKVVGADGLTLEVEKESPESSGSEGRQV